MLDYSVFLITLTRLGFCVTLRHWETTLGWLDLKNERRIWGCFLLRVPSFASSLIVASSLITRLPFSRDTLRFSWAQIVKALCTARSPPLVSQRRTSSQIVVTSEGWICREESLQLFLGYSLASQSLQESTSPSWVPEQNYHELQWYQTLGRIQY